MTLARWQATIVDDAGNVIDQPTITVRRDIPGQPLALIYSDRDGLAPLANPFTVAPGSAGYVSFHALGGAYQVKAEANGFTKTFRYVPVGRAAETDLTAFTPRGEWEDDVGYAIGDYVSHEGTAGVEGFISKVDDNLNHEPDADTPGDTEFWMHLPVLTASQAEDILADAVIAKDAAEAAQAAAETAETNAETAETNAEAAAALAIAAQGAAETAETNAETAETNAEAAQAAAEGARDAALTAETNAETAETNAEAAQTAAEAARDAALAAQAAAEFAADNFDDKYLGPHASDPTLDNDGGPLAVGNLYWNTSSSALKVYDGSAWQTYTAAEGLTALVDDPAPALGGDLSLNGNVITGLEIGEDVQAYSLNLDAWSAEDPADYSDTAAITAALANRLQTNVENQGPITGGAEVTSKALGTAGVVSTGTQTLDMADRPMQHYQNNGAHILAPGTVNGACILDITNGVSAGAITVTGWTKVSGDPFTTTNAHKFRCRCVVGNAGSTLDVEAFQ